MARAPIHVDPKVDAARPEARATLPVAVVCLLVAISYWPLTFTSDYTFLDYGDLVFQVLPWMQVQAAAWHAGIFPLWDPFIWNGQPLLGQAQPGAAFPLSWPLFLAPLDEAGRIQLHWVHWHFVAMHMLAGLLAYAGARVARCSRMASVFAGLAFATLGYVGAVWWPQMLHGAIWIPLTFLCARRAAGSRGRKSWAWAVLCGGAVGFAFLSGHHQAPLLGAFALAAYAIFLWFRRRRERGRLLARFAVAAVVAVLMSSFQMLPAMEYGRHAYRWVGLADPVTFEQKVPIEAHRAWSMEMSDFVHFAIPMEGFGPAPHVGLMVLGLMGVGVWAGRRRSETWFFVGLIVVVALYTLGPATPVHRLLYDYVPMVDKARSPERGVYIVQFALITLAAWGLDRLMRRWSARRAALAGAAAIALVLVEGQGGRLSRLHRISDAPVLDMLFQFDDAMDFLERQPQPFRFVIRTENKPNVGAWRGLEDANGYLASVSRELYDFFGRDWRGAELAMNTVYEIARGPSHDQQEKVFRGASGWNVYRNPDAQPRARFADLPDGCEATAEYRRIHLQRVEADVQLSCAAGLVIADPYFPGWRARADGVATDIVQHQGALMRVNLPPGRHRVELDYLPRTALAGAAMTALAALACAAAGFSLIRLRRAS